MNAIDQLSVATAVGMTLSLLITGEAFAFTFTKIADTSGSFDSFGNFAINNEGTVAFLADLDAGGSSIFSVSDGITTTLVDDSGSFDYLSDFAFNDQGTVAFSAFLEDVGRGIFTTNGETTTTIFLENSF